MKPRKYLVEKIAIDVRVFSNGHHCFQVILGGTTYGFLYWQDGFGFDDFANPPKYLTEATEAAIKQGIRDNRFRYHEHDSDGNRRYDNLRYHDIEMLRAWAYGPGYMAPDEYDNLSDDLPIDRDEP